MKSPARRQHPIVPLTAFMPLCVMIERAGRCAARRE